MITIVTQIPSPYQVEFFDALSKAPGFNVRILYEARSHRSRSWMCSGINHTHCFLDGGELQRAREWIRDSQLVVFSNYRNPIVRELMEARHQRFLPWVFWGERPGANFSGWLGRTIRRFAQSLIRTSKVPIWGIGTWAVEGYRKEIGEDRLYVNLPYFSNLDRYSEIPRVPPNSMTRIRFLYSGSLIERKGVDLLIRAFKRLSCTGIDAQLTLLGSGELETRLRRQAVVMSNRIKFVGFHQWQELPATYAQSDILVAPSRYDGWGLIVPEGLAASMSVIGTDRMGAALEMITDKNGWIVSAGKVDALYNAMYAAASQPPRLRALKATAARETSRAYTLASGVIRFREAVQKSIVACTQIGLSF